MTEEKRMICRLCLHIIYYKDKSVQLEQISNVVQNILPTLNLNVNSNSIVCGTCNELVQKSYKYKLSCLETVKYNKLYREEKNHLTVSEVMMKEEGAAGDNCCRFCLQPVEEHHFTEFGKMEVGVMEICIPELDPSLMLNDVICEKCLHELHIHYNFVEMCSNVEKTIQNYCETQGKEVNDETDLQNIFELSLKADRFEIKEEKLEEGNLKPREILIAEMNENVYVNCLTTQEISIKDESEGYGTHQEMEMQTDEKLKTESQEVRGGMMGVVTLECAEHLKSNCKRLSGRDLNKKHKGSTDLRTFRCLDCTYQTNYKSNLTKHMRVHEAGKFSTIMKGESRLQCTKCTYLITNKKIFKRHLLIHKDSRELQTYKCHNCSYQAKFKSLLAKHMLVHRDLKESEMFKCSQCEYQAKRKVYLDKHTLSVHRDSFLLARENEKQLLRNHPRDSSNSHMFKCQECSYQTMYKHNLRHHMVVHKDPTELEMYKCRQCTYQSKRKNELIRHTMLIHKDSTLFANGKKRIILECLKCTYQTSDRYSFKRHLIVHEGSGDSQMFECHNCSFTTKFKHNLIQHMLVHRNPTELKMFKCSQCEYQSKRKMGLKSHVMFAHKDSFLLARERKQTILECLKCNYQTIEEHSLKRHLVVHKNLGDSQMYQCHNCSFQTKFKSNLIKHIQKHRDPTELEMFKCSRCEFQAKRKMELKSHITHVHSDSFLLPKGKQRKLLQCQKCNYQTVKERFLKKHLVVHMDPSDLEMFKCHNCSFQTKFKQNIIQHMLVHKDPTELEMFKCSECEYQSKRKKGLQAHMLTHSSFLLAKEKENSSLDD